MSAPFEYETAILTKGGERRDVNITEASITSHEGKIIVMQDITERKRAETKLAKAVAELERSNEELEQFAYVASHDLQEPLRMVANFTSLLKERYHGRLDSDADDFIDYAVDGAKRMQKLIQGLLNYSRVSTRGKEFGSVDCEKLLKQTLTSLMTLIEENGAKVTNGALPTILADEDQMLQLKMKAKRRQGDKQVVTFDKHALFGASMGEIIGLLVSGATEEKKTERRPSSKSSETPVRD